VGLESAENMRWNFQALSQNLCCLCEHMNSFRKRAEQSPCIVPICMYFEPECVRILYNISIDFGEERAAEHVEELDSNTKDMTDLYRLFEPGYFKA
jgi:hypothetical protein